MELNRRWFNAIREGHKTVEGRRAGGSWESVAVGDVLMLKSVPDCGELFAVKVVRITRYSGPAAIRRFLEAEGVERALPGEGTVGAGIAVYEGIGPEWESAAVDLKGGMLAFGIERVEAP